MNQELIEMATKAGLFKDYGDGQGSWLANDKNLEAFAKLVAAKEREECAKLCEDLNLSQDSTWQVATLDCAEAIRERGEA